jgi:CubicO group peptidase (beta-lactamase class C family)
MLTSRHPAFEASTVADMPEVHGFCDDRLRSVREAFEQNFLDGLEVGASLCVTHRGERVLDLWAGHRDPQRDVPWEEDTLALVFSTTKIATITCVLIQLDRGKLELEAPVADYWPEFAQAGKEAITVKQILTHTGGVPGLREPVSQSTLSDFDAVIRLIEREPPWFAPGTVCVYHPMHFGYIVGELVRRTSAKGPREFFQDEVAAKLDIDFSIGVRCKADLPRLARWVDRSVPPTGLDDVLERIMASYSLESDSTAWDLWAENPAANGWTNGRAVARLCALFANGGELDGVRVLSREITESAGSVHYEGEDLFWGVVRYGLGFGLDSDGYHAPTPTSFHWGGFGGSWGLMDIENAVSAGYVMNAGRGNRREDVRQERIWSALSEVMPVLGRD